MSAIYYDYIFCISKFELNQYKKNLKNRKYLARKKIIQIKNIILWVILSMMMYCSKQKKQY